MIDKNIGTAVIERARKIKLILMDVDGVLTDGRIFFLPNHEGGFYETKGFDSQDGLGLHFCRLLGIPTGVISGRDSQAVVERAKMLGMKYVYQGKLEKLESFQEILKDAGCSESETVFIGDDMTDAVLMRRVGLAVAVANARPEVRSIAHYVTQADGGRGAVREAIEMILKAQGLWEKVLERYNLQAQEV
jgi:3-deoxy-D-manno-octulosonate 8-phosphate phosphatase (KDO 8-P phosphatase)